MADLGEYQRAANAIYDPQKEAEYGQLAAVRDTTKSSLEAQKGSVQTNYESAINDLKHSVEDQTGQINQLYSQRLGGNFSGLQGNDMGQMYSRANEQTASIASARADKLSQITAGEANADIQYTTDFNSTTSKYKALANQYADEGYSGAVKAEQDQANKDRDYALQVAKFQQSASNSGSSAANAAAGKYSVKQLTSGNKSYTGPNGQTNLYQFAAGSNGGDPQGTYDTILSELKTGSTTDKAAYNKIAKMSVNQGISYLQQHNSYIFD